MTCVLDASAAIALVFKEQEAAFCADILAESDWVLAPDLFVSEVTNAFWKYHRFENLPLPVCEELLYPTMALVDHFIEASSLY
ncbi:MAG: type II toxin-antitoxin system VapC family toxin [candidate division KSB1 bacterium]|nr:type II toxin-antitoxin system VapC family toxin [candidate division KSB1 bacterium]MDQ7063253.1 type II toxin-antitoxin system VapC family toxin [candidate division KSB1 bacterium]